MQATFGLLLISIFLSSCNSGSDNKNSNNDGSPSGANYATYEMIEGCTTGVKKFNAGSEQELNTTLCESLKNNESNGNCAQAQREMIYKSIQCAGNWPHPVISGYVSTSSNQYSYRENSCTTGTHYISANTATKSQKALCLGLLDDERNLNCARGKREEKYEEYGCKEILK